MRGIYKKLEEDDLIEITELPVGIWTTPYKEYLSKLIDKKIIVNYKSDCTD